ncbi:MAG: Gfo/Idh/MocA family oxidoreductase [Planctomycetota bacterium]|nr:Gfo/Idh/MocA family oxidoreductase [Planctomycetota bacterium]
MSDTAIDTLKVGIIGTGKISDAYQTGCTHYHGIELVRCADLDLDRAKAKAEEWGVNKHGSVDDLLNDDEVDLVVNLTIPQAHAEVDRLALEAGKHVHSEKPLALNRDEAAPILALAKAKGLRLGCAPDTFLGSGHQLARKCIDDGLIGRPTSVTAFMLGRGHEHWHPAPEFYYKAGGGPLFDMGPYYLTALVNMLGPVKRVAGFVGRAFDERTISSEPLAGTVMTVDIDTHVAATLEFASGSIGTLITSFDIAGHNLPRIQVHGTTGSLDVPDPNGFGGEVKLMPWGESEWQTQDDSHSEGGQRGAGPADIAHALVSGRAHRASGDLAFHILDVMQSIVEAGHQGRVIDIASTCERPAAIPAGTPAGVFD